MGKVIGIIAVLLVVAVVVAVIAFGNGGGIGGGAGDGEGDGNTKVVTNKENSSNEENNTIITDEEKEEKEEEEEETKEQNNGATDTFEGAIVKITVVENEYFYDNERITLDDFMIIIHDIKTDLVVEVKDDNASLRAYNDLIDRLEEEKIRYVEE